MTTPKHIANRLPDLHPRSAISEHLRREFFDEIPVADDDVRKAWRQFLSERIP